MLRVSRWLAFDLVQTDSTERCHSDLLHDWAQDHGRSWGGRMRDRNRAFLTWQYQAGVIIKKQLLAKIWTVSRTRSFRTHLEMQGDENARGLSLLLIVTYVFSFAVQKLCLWSDEDGEYHHWLKQDWARLIDLLHRMINSSPLHLKLEYFVRPFIFLVATRFMRMWAFLKATCAIAPSQTNLYVTNDNTLPPSTSYADTEVDALKRQCPIFEMT